MSSSIPLAMLAVLLAVLLAGLTAWLVDEMGARRGLMPTAFVKPHRRAAGLTILAGALLLGIYAPLALALSGVEPPPAESLTIVQLFAVQIILAVTLICWFLFGYFELSMPLGREQLTVWAKTLGLTTSRLGSELRLGVVAGIGAWALALAVAIAAAVTLALSGHEELLPRTPASSILWIAGLPLGVRILASFSAGLIEELFFRGFLQSRVGIVGSTALFVTAHAGYGQPFMFFGLTVLSLIYAGLFQWRQNVWAPVAAHILFDLIQLVVVIPLVLGMPTATGGP